MELAVEACSASPLDRFSQAIATLLLYLREEGSHQYCVAFLEGILPQLQAIGRAAEDAIAGAGLDSLSSVRELHLHALNQVVQTTRAHWSQSLKQIPNIGKEGNEANNRNNGDREALQFEQQRSLARSTELILIFIRITMDIQSTGDATNNDNRVQSIKSIQDTMIQEYAEFQRKLLRQRSKPAIAALASLRQNGAFATARQMSSIASTLPNDDDDDEAEEIRQHHADTLADVLQHALHLLHPLLAWRASSPVPDSLETLCDVSIGVLRQQAVNLIIPLANWFYEDRDINGWRKQTAAKFEKSDSFESIILPRMDAVVSELADICRMLQDFCPSVFSAGGSDPDEAAVVAPLKRLIAEWTVHYGALESYLVLQQYSSCIPQAVVTVVDSDIRVPSMVEDAHCLTMNALQRAPSVQTIAYALAHDIWSTDDANTSTVFGMLQRRDGCQVVAASGESSSSAPHSGNFADALALAMDEPAHLILDEHFCYWNGMHAASAAVKSFAEVVSDDQGHDRLGKDSTADEAPNSSIISIVREDLERFAQSYESTLDWHLGAVIEKLEFWDNIRDFFQQETYELSTPASMAAAEADDRLDTAISAPVRSSRFVQQIQLKAEAFVQPLIWNKLARHAAGLLMAILCETKPTFSEWGALLFAKQVRVLQTSILSQDVASWGGLTEAVALLQLEQPSDWNIYRVDFLKRLSMEQVAVILSLRVDFSKEAVANVVQRN